MNWYDPLLDYTDSFLNGVCRHEPLQIKHGIPLIFLNGVCRHEPIYHQFLFGTLFLNGVCRHEQL